MPPTCPNKPLPMAHKPTKKATSPILLLHANVFHHKHSNFLSVQAPNTAPHDEVEVRFGKDVEGNTDAHPQGRTRLTSAEIQLRAF